MIGKHRKLHLFDVDVPGGFSFREKTMFTPGNSITVCETSFGKIGIGVCNDLRYPEQARLMAEKGAKILIYPSAFSLTTGSRHWEPLLRARALENQVNTSLFLQIRFS
jgi:predicted amidohydrolase